MQGVTQSLYYPERAREAIDKPLDTIAETLDAAKVTVFHPPLNVIPNGNHFLFIPPLGCSDLSPYAEKLSEVANRRKSMLYAVIFPETMSEKDRSMRQMIRDAQQLFRGGSISFQVIVCELETFLFVSLDKGWRRGRDTVVMFESL